MAFFIVDTNLNIMKIEGKAVQDIFYHTDPKTEIISNSNYTNFQKELVRLIREAKAKEEQNG